MTKKIKIAIQNKGKLYESSIEYLKKRGLFFTVNNDRELQITAANNEAEIFLARHADIPEYLKNNLIDFGIMGENVLLETYPNIHVVEKLGFGKCMFVFAVPEKSTIYNMKDLENKSIATSHPNILRKILKKENVKSAIITLKGSIEISPLLNMSDAIFDITQTGETLKRNKFRIIKNSIKSEAVLVASEKGKNSIFKKTPETATVSGV